MNLNDQISESVIPNGDILNSNRLLGYYVRIVLPNYDKDLESDNKEK